MKNERRHKRYNLDLIEITGKMSLSEKVEILDISLGGVALKADRRLDLGREYLIKLQAKGKTLNVAGIVVRSELSGMEKNKKGESVTIYSAGMMFKDGSIDAVAEFLKSMEHNKKEAAVPVLCDRRLSVRFQIITPHEKILSYPVQFRVKKISLGGMLIETEQALELESRLPMELSLNDGTTINFTGRVASCQLQEDKEQTRYEIGVEFTDLTDKYKMVLKAFIDGWGPFLLQAGNLTNTETRRIHSIVGSSQ